MNNNSKNTEIIKKDLEKEFWVAHEENDFDKMNSICTKMAKINDGDSYRLYKSIPKKL